MSLYLHHVDLQGFNKLTKKIWKIAEICTNMHFLVIVHFNYFWNFRVFSGQTASGRPPR
jgi:hypothetical protein